MGRDFKQQKNKREYDELKRIAALTAYEGSDMLIGAAVSDEQVAREDYLKQNIMNALWHVFCTRTEAYDFFRRYMMKRIPELKKDWHKELSKSELRAHIIVGTQLLTKAMKEDRDGQLFLEQKCELLQFAEIPKGEVGIYENRKRMEHICRHKCGLYKQDIENGTTNCPLSRYDIPNLIKDFSYHIEDNEIRGCDVLSEPEDYMERTINEFILLVRKRRSILNSDWETMWDKVLAIQEFRTIDEIGKMISTEIQKPIMNLLKAMIEIKRGAPNYNRFLSRYMDRVSYKCELLEGKEDFDSMIGVCQYCQKFSIDAKYGTINCDKFYLSLGE